MSKYGRKFACWSCGTKFYDLNKPNPKCPKCGADPAENPALAGAGGAEDFLGYEGEDLDDELDEPEVEEDEDADLEEGVEEEEEY